MRGIWLIIRSISTLTRLNKCIIKPRGKDSYSPWFDNTLFKDLANYFLAILGGSLKNTEKKITPSVPASKKT